MIQCKVQFLSELLGRARQRAWITVAHAGAIIGTHSRGPGRSGLDPAAPGRRPITPTRIDHHGGIAFTQAVEVESMAAHPHH